MTYTNEDMFQAKLPIDHLVVVTEEPKRQRTLHIVNIDLAAPAAVHEKHAHKYQQPYTVGDIRRNSGPAKNKNLWLLSGGTVIRDHRGRFAVGLRDGNAADAFKFTNIGAGRCDQKLEDHCYEELVSEFILCVKEGGKWVQVQFCPPELPPLLQQVRSKQQTIEKWKADGIPRAGLMPVSSTRIKESPAPKRDLKNLEVNWTKNEELVHRERLDGYLLLDIPNRSLEFRLPYALDLHAYGPADVEVFFAEGTGYADWKSKQELQRLEALSMVTPLLKALILLQRNA